LLMINAVVCHVNDAPCVLSMSATAYNINDTALVSAMSTTTHFDNCPSASAVYVTQFNR